MKKLSLILLAMVLFLIFGFILADSFGYMDPEKWQGWLKGVQSSSQGRIFVAVTILGLLMIDLLLPVPSSLVMAFSGMFLGVWIGGVVSFLGAILAACMGFGLCRWGGQAAFKRLIGNQDLSRINRWFSQYGVYAIIISRPIPMLTEILSCLAGLTAIRFRIFLVSSILGTLPICFVYSYVGSKGDITDPWLAIWIAILIPALGWLITRRITGGMR